MSEWSSPPPPNSDSRVTLQEDKTWGAVAYGAPLAGYVFTAGLLSFVASIVIYIVSKDKSPLARQYAAGALNLQLNALIWILVSIVLMFVLIGFLTIIVAAVGALILNILGLVKALNGDAWSPPFCIKFVS